ncbi:MAG: ABC transporter permease, partial [Planctomycetaceae bacterium]|nr:ABC transporter permease [Planctomycetaceae bacterium]
MSGPASDETQPVETPARPLLPAAAGPSRKAVSLQHVAALLARRRAWILPLVLLLELAIFLPYSGIRLDSPATALTGLKFYTGDLLSQAAPLLILAGGMTLVLMTAGIDLSVGSMVALVGCVISTFPGDAAFWYTAVPLGLVLGLGLGLFNGLLISRMDVPPIVATLGTLFFYRGLCSVVMRGRENSPFYDVPGYEVLGAPLGCLAIVLVLAVAGGWYFRHSALRRELLMLGGNR